MSDHRFVKHPHINLWTVMKGDRLRGIIRKHAGRYWTQTTTPKGNLRKAARSHATLGVAKKVWIGNRK